MKRFLSLVLTLVMVMSLVTVSAGAKDFTDDDKITYDEAVAVISTIGVVDGDKDGSFRPTDTLTRQAAAKIICNLILGPTTAAELHADTAPYKDVAVNNQFAGYIAYCQSRGIISGYKDGTFRPTGTLTGYAFMKMLLGALGYDSSLEGYVGENWSINVAKQALGIGLNKGLQTEFNGIKAVTREEACLYAFRTIQSDLVEYGQRLTTNVNGTEVTLSSGGAKSRYWNSQQSRNDYIRSDNIIQFAEEYFNKLEKRKDRDEFERPAYTWIYDKEEIGTYVDWELLVERYTTGVSGRDLYDLLGATAIKDNDLVYYVNGLVPTNNHPMNTAAYDGKKVSKASDITKETLVRSNKNDAGISDNGVLTEVFLDKDAEVITITSIDTFLAKAVADYNDSKEYAPLEVYTGLTGEKDAKKTTKTTWNVDKEDVAGIVDVKDGDFKLVNITFKNDNKGEVVTLATPDIMEESTVTKFTKDDSSVASKVTVGGTEYKAARRAFFSDDALYWYDETLLTDKTYNVYMDPYGYFIGVELFEGAKNYVFITGFDRPTSNLAISTAKANGIFLDGTMQNITVNVKATNTNIRTANTTKQTDSYQYFIEWGDEKLPGTDGCYRYNRWFTYSVNADGVYTLKPCTRMTATKYTTADTVIRTDNLYVDDNVYRLGDNPYKMDGSRLDSDGKTYTIPPYTATKNERSYGEDDTVFITVSLDDTDTSGGPRAITDVDGVYTGVQNVEIEIDELNEAEEAQVYTVYDSDHYMIGAIAIGEAKGANATLAYVVSAAKNERIEDGTYYWEFDAILNGEVQTLTVKSKYDVFDQNAKATIEAENQKKMISGSTSNLNDGLVELRFDTDEYVVDVRQIDEKHIYNFYGNRYPSEKIKALKGANSIAASSVYGEEDQGRPLDEEITPTTSQLDLRDAKAYRINVIRNNWSNHYADSVPSELSLKGRTLYVTAGQIDEGLALASDAKAVVIQKENNKNNVLTEWATVETALKHIADKDPNTAALEFDGEVIAVMNDRGAAAWVVFKTDRELYTGVQGGPAGPADPSIVVTVENSKYGPIKVQGPKGTPFSEVQLPILQQLSELGYDVEIDYAAMIALGGLNSNILILKGTSPNGTNVQLTYDHSKNFTSNEEVKFEAAKKTVESINNATNKNQTSATISGVGANDAPVTSISDADAKGIVEKALDVEDDVVIEVDSVTVDPAVVGTQESPAGKDGEAVITAKVYEKKADGTKDPEKFTTVTMRVKLTAKSYANSDTAKKDTQAVAVLKALNNSKLDGWEKKDGVETALDYAKAKDAVKAKVEEELVKVLGEDHGYTVAVDAEEQSAANFQGATIGTLDSQNGKDGFIIVTVGLTGVKDSEQKVKVILTGLNYGQTEKGAEILKLIEAVKTAEIEAVNLTNQGQTEGVTAEMSGNAVTVTGAVTVPDANKDDFQSGFNATWTKGNSILLTIGHYQPKDGELFADGVTVTFGGAAGSKNAYTLASGKDLLVKVPVAVKDGKGTTQTYTVQWYKGGTISGMEITGGTKLGDPITIAIDATGVTHTVAPAAQS